MKDTALIFGVLIAVYYIEQQSHSFISAPLPAGLVAAIPPATATPAATTVTPSGNSSTLPSGAGTSPTGSDWSTSDINPVTGQPCVLDDDSSDISPCRQLI